MMTNNCMLGAIPDTGKTAQRQFSSHCHSQSFYVTPSERMFLERIPSLEALAVVGPPKHASVKGILVHGCVFAGSSNEHLGQYPQCGPSRLAHLQLLRCPSYQTLKSEAAR